MDTEQAERRFRQLQAARDRGALDDSTFRVQVAQLMFRDSRGVFWMIDAGDGAWYCNRGDAWEPGDPRAEKAAAPAPPPQTRPNRLRRARLRAAAVRVALVALLGLALILVWQWSAGFPGPISPASTATPAVRVSIASPDDGSRVTVGREVAVESTIHGPAGLEGIERVELLIGGQVVDAQPVRSRVGPEQTSLPVSQHWMPSAVGEQQIAVVALSAEGEPLGQAAITVTVAELAGESLPEPACSPDAAFLADVTIAPGTAFPPGAQMDKVWQVRNSGTCAWGVGYQLVRLQGEALGAADRVSVPPTVAGATADLSVTFSAPSQAGTYTNTWQLHTPDGAPFGPELTLSIEVEVEAQANVPPDAPSGLQASVTEDGAAVQLTWLDQSDNEDAFRVYREDVEASIGLAPANARLFVDKSVACSNSYRYRVVAFNAAGASAAGDAVEVTLPPCAPAATPAPALQ
jgi:hypothetical protein